jgi:hypothetical protein
MSITEPAKQNKPECIVVCFSQLITKTVNSRRLATGYADNKTKQQV